MNSASMSQASTGAISYTANVGIGVARNYYDPGEHTVTGSAGGDVGAFTAKVTALRPLAACP